MPTLEFPIPFAESGKVYAPGTFAREIVNFQRTTQNTLVAVRGPCPLIPNYGAGYPGQYARMYGCFHARLSKGMRDVLLVRTGDKLVEQWGQTRTMRTLKSGLSEDTNAKYPDQFCLLNGRIIWTNGIDRAYIYDGYRLLPLGYQETPSAPTVLGPSNDGHPVFTNEAGYSHPGRIGTIGDVFNDGEGTLLNGTWYYAVQYEDAFGNLSPLSPLSGAAIVRTERTSSYYWADYANYPETASYTELGFSAVVLDDLQRQFFLEGIPLGPEGTKKRHIYRTADATRNPNTLRKLVTIDDNVTTCIPDNFPDAALGDEAPDVIPVPAFSIMAAHQGSLWIVVGSRVYKSQPGFPGTFERNAYIDLDGDGTGLASWNGSLIACTETATYAIIDDAEGLRKRPLSASDGCVAPGSMRTCGFGALVWLGQDGFKGMGADMIVKNVSEEQDTFFTRLNPALLGRAQATWRSSTKEYLCALPEAGVVGNNVILAFDGEGWRRLRYGIRWGGLCETQDWTRRLIGVGYDTSATQHNVFVLDGEHRDYTPPTRTNLYRTTWLKPDVFGRRRFSSATLYIGVVETGSALVTVRLYQNYRMETVSETKTFTPAVRLPATMGTVAASATTAASTGMVLGTDVVRTPRLTWKRVDFRVKSAESIAFDITTVYPSQLHIHAIAFEFSYEDAGEMMSRD